jgi:hypothetical protein
VRRRNADGSAAVSDDSATANANASAEDRRTFRPRRCHRQSTMLLNTNTNTSATVE